MTDEQRQNHRAGLEVLVALMVGAETDEDIAWHALTLIRDVTALAQRMHDGNRLRRGDRLPGGAARAQRAI